MSNGLYRLLEHPFVYQLSQGLVAPGAEGAIARTLKALLSQLPPAQLMVDVGCGPASRLFRVGRHPVGVDISLPYIRAYTKRDLFGIVTSAGALPFSARSFDGVWSIGLLHYLSDELAKQAIREMVRICRPGGYVGILNGVLPRSPWRRPVAYAIRRLDRGRFMRSESSLRSLLPAKVPFHITRTTCAFNGLELLVCWSTMNGTHATEVSARVSASLPVSQA